MDDAYTQASDALDAMPGIAQVSARVILAEIGVDMTRFPLPITLCSWAGICPGNNESAGKRKSGRTTAGLMLRSSPPLSSAPSLPSRTRTLTSMPSISVWLSAAAKTAPSSPSLPFHDDCRTYHVLSGNAFHDLGADYYNSFNTQKKIDSYLSKLRKLGLGPAPRIASA